MIATISPVRLNIGCGETRRPGFVGLDVRPCTGADHVGPAWDLTPFPAGTVDEIYSRHMLEHLDPNDARRTLTAWFAALRPGGLLRLIVPDLAFHAQQLLGAASNWTPDPDENERHALAGFFGWRDEARGGDREDAHRWGYTESSLFALLADAGFANLERVTTGEDCERWHLHVTARKPTDEKPVVQGSALPAQGGALDHFAATSVVLHAGQSVSPTQAQSAAEQLLRDWRGRGALVVFGAGAHTRKILPALLRHGDRIAGIADDSPAAWGTIIGRWVVNPPQRGIDSDIGGIIVSSDTQQQPLADRIRREFGGRCAVLTLYATADDASGPALPATGERQTGRALEEIEIGHRARYYWAAQHIPAGARVLDAACGNGYGSRILSDCGARVLGLDVSESAVAFAQHHFAAEHATFAAAAIDDGRSLRLIAERRGPFDAAVSLETLEHLEHPDVFLRDAAALLRPGGQLFCSTPNAEVMDLAEAPYHRRHFTTAEVSALLESCGFELLAWFGQEGLQITPARATPQQRYCLYHTRRR